LTVRERLGRVVRGPGTLTRAVDIPLDLLFVTIGVAVYAHIPHATGWTIGVLYLCAETVRRAIAEIVAATPFRTLLRPPRARTSIPNNS
jgi:hypothetical protein